MTKPHNIDAKLVAVTLHLTGPAVVGCLQKSDPVTTPLSFVFNVIKLGTLERDIFSPNPTVVGVYIVISIRMRLICSQNIVNMVFTVYVHSTCD